jgi:Glycosyl transferases group 1
MTAYTRTANPPGGRLQNALQSWRYIVRERFLKLLPPSGSRFPPSWPIDPREAKSVLIRWPTNYQWEGTQQWVGNLLYGLRRYVRVERTPIPQPYAGVLLVELLRQGKTYEIALDYSDYMDRIDQSCLGRAALYFKMQYRQEGYGSDRVIPGGYVNASSDFYKYLSWLRSVQSSRQSKFDVYGRFGLQFAREIRQRAVVLLETQTRFRYEGSLSIVRYQRSLEEAARSRVCIDLPGNGDFCFRLIDYLGIGACVVAPRHRTVLHVPLEDRKHIILAKEDLSDLLELCAYYVEHKQERDQIVTNSQEFYDRYLHRDQLAGYYLSKCLDRIRRI